MMYEEENNATDHKAPTDDIRMPSNETAIGISGGTSSGRLPGYWQHAATSAAGYWSSLFDSWTTNPIATGSQSLSIAWDENRG
uniref:Uncharacterized protein n=1 Tax=Bracon brevicornis TaxID=1563983 RepID=A0A6V7LIT6_9HYME